jgi:hypothetical protein
MASADQFTAYDSNSNFDIGQKLIQRETPIEEDREIEREQVIYRGTHTSRQTAGVHKCLVQPGTHAADKGVRMVGSRILEQAATELDVHPLMANIQSQPCLVESWA